jgi:hypothetical protein
MDDMTQLILKKLDDLERKMDHMMSNGCAKVTSHAEVVENQREIFSRLGVVERAQAEGKGKLAVACAVLGAFVAFGLQWLGKHL